MNTYKKVDRTYFPQYDQIPMIVHVSAYYRIEKDNRGLGGFALVETPIEPYIKDFCTGDDESITRWEKRWNISNWAFFMAFDGERPIGGATVATRTKEINMLSGRNDLAVLWDIRVADAYKYQGIGQALLDMAVDWSREQGFVQMKIECQNNNIPAVKFYFIFTEVKDNPSRRPFPRSEQHFEMLSMGQSIVVSASPKILEIVKPLLDGKGRDEAFSLPFVYGHSLYYLPDLPQIKSFTSPDGFAYEIVEQSEIPLLYRSEGFRNAVQYDASHPRPDILVTLAKKDGRIVGMAGASSDCAMMWQVGMDVLPEYRNHGLAAYLVNWLTLEILERGYVPYYGTASSNIASQRVAHRAGYFPAWVCAYKGKFDGLECSPTS